MVSDRGSAMAGIEQSGTPDSHAATVGRGGSGVGLWIVRVTATHVVTYLAVGLIAALAIDYASVFAQPVVRDYMREFGSVASFVGPLVQVVRGVVFALVLLPFRAVISARWGWLHLWLLLVGVGILSTPAAAPSSIEGVVYSALPLWYHALGLPEVLVQLLLFSVVVAWFTRHPGPVVEELPARAERLLRALVVACLSFVGYAVASVLFAVAVSAPISAEGSLTWSVQGLFVAPVLANGVIVFSAAGFRGQPLRVGMVAGAAAFATGVIAIAAYQALVFGSASIGYAILAPLLPAVIVGAMVRPAADVAPVQATASATEGREASD
ncbi:hypothetical protein [Microbacterium sp. ABRD28]|uniref:hypothetical protein n=1 Tax=Microbacterium sp. ABRD28 TaxID=2268461 RepID=UPI000F5585F4|nr:hypothetical protein [Microbacterium sp. ABRD28]